MTLAPLSAFEVGWPSVRVGTAGWSIPREQAEQYPGTRRHIERYARRMNCAEINSSFYRSHRASTYERWAASTPDGFLFSVKVAKAITHECALAPTRGQIESFLAEVKPLGPKLGPLLLQLPPKQAFAEEQARRFIGLLRDVDPGVAMVVEPRHPGWFSGEAGALLRQYQVGRVIADPLPAKVGAQAEERQPLAYYRLHGSPRIYYSSYSGDSLEGLAAQIRVRLARREDVWCIFDNTASGAALGNALTLAESLKGVDRQGSAGAADSGSTEDR